MKFYENRGSFVLKLSFWVVINSISGIKIFNLDFKTWSSPILVRIRSKTHLSVNWLNLAHLQGWVCQLWVQGALKLSQLGAINSKMTIKYFSTGDLDWGPPTQWINFLPGLTELKSDKIWLQNPSPGSFRYPSACVGLSWPTHPPDYAIFLDVSGRWLLVVWWLWSVSGGCKMLASWFTEGIPVSDSHWIMSEVFGSVWIRKLVKIWSSKLTHETETEWKIGEVWIRCLDFFQKPILLHDLEKFSTSAQDSC